MTTGIDRNLELVKKANLGDKDAEQQLVEQNMGLIWKIVKKFYNRGHEPEDLFQIGSIGFIKAIKKFNTDYNVRFSTYAVPMIIGEIKKFIRDDGIIKVSREVKKTWNNIRNAKDFLSKQLGRDPTIRELADRLNITPEELAVAMDAGAAPESLNAPLYEGETNTLTLMDMVGLSNYEENEIVDKIALNNILNELNVQERKIILLRYFKEKTQVQIAEMMGISQVQVSRLERKIIQRIKEKMK